MGTLEVIIKRLKPNLFSRIKNGWKVGVATLLGLCTVLGFVFTLFQPLNFGYLELGLISVALIAICLIVAYLRGRQKLLPDVIFDEFSSENRYTITFCDNQSLKEADEMTKPYFGRDFIPFNQIEQWRLKNKKGFVRINNAEGVLCSCFVILGLERSFLDQFIAGRVTEHDIDSEVILNGEEMKKEDRIYISGVVVRDPHSFIGSKRARVMVWAMLQYIKIIFGLRRQRTFYALALTKESEKLLQALEFTICGNKGGRKDNSNLYRIDLNKRKWDELMGKIGDYSSMVSLELNPKQSIIKD